MDLNNKDSNECVRQFVKSFVWKNRQERLLEMINKNNWRKFTNEIFNKQFEHNLNPYTSLFIKSSITLIDLAELCPQIAKANECCVIDYENISIFSAKSSNFLVDLEDYFETTCILSFIPGELAVFSSEYKALCFHMKGFNGILAKHPKFINIVDKSMYKR